MAAPDLLDRLAKGWRAYALVALLTLAAGLPGVFRIPPLDRDESRFAQATVQMLETGDYVRIAVQDQPRNKKPVGIHWLQAASVSLFSKPEAREIWAYRLPSLLGALIAALATFWGGTALFDRRTALAGAMLFSCCLLLSTEALIAKTDAMLCGLTTLAMAALAQLYGRLGKEASRLHLRGMSLIFWAALGGAILIKGPVPLAVVGLCLLTLAAWERRWDWMRVLLWWPGPIIAALIVLPWVIAIGIETNGRFFAEAFADDLAPKLGGGDEGHAGPFGFHAALVWLLLFPASILLPAALIRAWPALRASPISDEHSTTRFLIAWAAPTWLLFELLPTKLPHYVLPAYPALALLCGAALIDLTDRAKTAWSMRALFVLCAAGLAALAAYLSTLMFGDAVASERRAIQAGMLAAPLVLAGLVLVWRAKRPALVVLTGGAAIILFNWSARDRILPEARPWLVSAEASNALMRAGLHPRLSPGAGQLTSVGFNEPSFVFLTRTDTDLGEGAEAAASIKPGGAAIVEARQAPVFEAGLRARGLAFEPIGAPIVGFNYSNGDEVSLQPGRVSSAGERAP